MPVTTTLPAGPHLPAMPEPPLQAGGFRWNRFKFDRGPETARQKWDRASLADWENTVESDAKLGLLAGLGAVLVVAVVYFKKPAEEAVAVGDANPTALTGTSLAPPPRSIDMHTAVVPAVGVGPEKDQGLRVHPVAQPNGPVPSTTLVNSRGKQPPPARLTSE